MKVKERVEKLRQLMKSKGIDAYIVPSFDAHQSEYVAEHWKERQWISGFTGSAGTAVITLDEAGLWTDGRYFIQAANQLKDSGIELFKMGQPGVPTYIEWIKSKGIQCIGFDGKVFPVNIVNNIKKSFGDKEIKFEINYDLIDEIWTDRPEIPSTEVFIHEVKYSGKSRVEKLNEVRKEMKEKGTNYYLISSLDDIAWLFNIRGRDVPKNPVTISHAIISEDKAYLFIDNSKINKEVRKELEKDNICIKEYNEIDNFLKQLDEKTKVLYDETKTSIGLYNCLKDEIKKIETPNITTKLKSIKNEVEIENLKKCLVRDGVAMVKFIKWLKENVKKEKITEIIADEKLEGFRKQGDLFVEISFDTIAGYKDHAAMMHFKANEDNTYELKKEGLLLVDSGGQYFDGTTDITRTIALGKLTEEEKEDFTLVLKSNIQLSMVKFLYGATGNNVDIIARKPIWDRGMDYKCGTGHGVGFFLNVHEGPQRLSQAPNTTVLEKGMILTNEPGIYKENKHGIRTENMMIVDKAENTELGGQFMKFETVTFCPIDIAAIKVEMLTEEERNWFNNYHKEVYNKLSPYLDDEEKTWLEEQTKAI